MLPHHRLFGLPLLYLLPHLLCSAAGWLCPYRLHLLLLLLLLRQLAAASMFCCCLRALSKCGPLLQTQPLLLFSLHTCLLLLRIPSAAADNTATCP
jgi:hypothetical protein